MRRMNRPDLVTFLRDARFGVVASTQADGRPQAAVVGVAVTDRLEIVFDTLASTRKVRNLRRDPRVAVVVTRGEATAQIEGRADEPTGADGERLRAAYLAAWPDGRERLAWAGITHVRVIPTWVRFTDFATGGEALEWEGDALAAWLGDPLS